MEKEGNPSSENMLVSADKNTEATVKSKTGFMVGNLIETMIIYGLATYLVIIISFNLPFLMREYHFSSGNAGIATSLFFLAIMIPGLAMKPIIRVLKDITLFVSFVAIAVGLMLILVAPTGWLMALGLHSGRTGVWRHPAVGLRKGDPHGCPAKSHHGTGIHHGHELHRDTGVSVHHRLFRMVFAFRHPAVSVRIQSGHYGIGSRLCLDTAKILRVQFMVNRPAYG